MEVLFLLFGNALIISFAFCVFYFAKWRFIFLIMCSAIQAGIYSFVKHGYVFYWKSYWDFDGGNIGRSIGFFLGTMLFISSFSLIGAIISIFQYFSQKKKFKEDVSISVYRELEGKDKMDENIWAASFCEASGDKEKARRIYIKKRTDFLIKKGAWRHYFEK